MLKNLAQLKKLPVGTKLRLIWRFGKELNEEKEIAKVQSNAIAFKKGDGLSWLYLPPAARMEFTGRGFIIYAQGLRDLTPDEKEVLDNVPKDPEQERIDALSDGSTMFYREKAYFKKYNMMHLTVYNKGRRLHYDKDNKPRIIDPLVKGEKELEYIF